MKERVDEIDAEQDGDAKTDNGFIHGVAPQSRPQARA
jgi:hypothetical protein